MRIERISGAILILLSGVLLLMAAYGGTPEDRDATAILLTLPMGLVALFTEIPERGKPHQARLPGVKPATLTN